MRKLYFLLLALFLCTCVRAQNIIRVEDQGTVNTFTLNLLLQGAAKYDVQNYKVVYTTTDALGRPDTASGLLSVPLVPELSVPLAIYMHGTVTNREAVPSRVTTQERILVYALSTNGYITVAPDYIGLGDSDGFHPYVHADSESQSGRDLLLAARSWLEEQSIPFNDQLFVTGYSQGGHAAQALHRDLQLEPGDDELVVTAGAHLSGPYSISDVMREAALMETPGTIPAYIVYTYVSYNNVYGLFDNLGEVFVSPYREAIDSFNVDLLSPIDFNTRLTILLNASGDRLIDMFQDSIATQLRTDDDDSRIIQALRDNDTYEWAPEAPTLLYYCTEDEQVPFRNAILADSVMRALGSTMVVTQSGGALTHGECVLPAALSTLTFFNQYAMPGAVSTSQPVDFPELGIAPNPVAVGGQLLVSGLPVNTEYRFRLYDIAGRELQTGLFQAGKAVGLSDRVQPGLHLLRIGLPNGNFVVRRVMVR